MTSFLTIITQKIGKTTVFYSTAIILIFSDEKSVCSLTISLICNVCCEVTSFALIIIFALFSFSTAIHFSNPFAFIKVSILASFSMLSAIVFLFFSAFCFDSLDELLSLMISLSSAIVFFLDFSLSLIATEKWRNIWVLRHLFILQQN